jgi:hypothetical protein
MSVKTRVTVPEGCSIISARATIAAFAMRAAALAYVFEVG